LCQNEDCLGDVISCGRYKKKASRGKEVGKPLEGPQQKDN